MKLSFLLDRDKLRRLLWAGIGLFFLGAFVKLTWELKEDANLDSWDKEILLLVSHFRRPLFTELAVDLTALGSPTILTIVVLFSILLMGLRRDRSAIFYLLIGALGSGIFTFLLKLLFKRARPSIIPSLIDVSGFSYPSGHSLASTSIFFLLMFLGWRAFPRFSHRIVLLLCTVALACAVGLSRVYLGVHYPSDVFSGLCLGAAWAFLLTSLYSI